MSKPIFYDSVRTCPMFVIRSAPTFPHTKLNSVGCIGKIPNSLLSKYKDKSSVSVIPVLQVYFEG